MSPDQLHLVLAVFQLVALFYQLSCVRKSKRLQAEGEELIADMNQRIHLIDLDGKRRTEQKEKQCEH